MISDFRTTISIFWLAYVYLLLSACVGVNWPTITSERQSQPPGQSRQAKVGSYVVFGEEYHTLADSRGYLEIGVASWYGRKFHGRLTANGETFDMYQMSAAHKALPLPTYVKVTNLDNMRNVVLKVNDRGPFHDDWLIDLSYEAARQLGFVDKGIATVVVEAVDDMNHTGPVEPPPQDTTSYYLQLGAFSNRDGAEKMLQSVLSLTRSSALAEVDIKILEAEDDDRRLHKVWLGPVSSNADVETLSMLVQNANLGEPLRVKLK